MSRWQPILLLCALLVACSQDLEREQACRTAVRSLVAAPERAVRHELDKVVAFGTYALPDIEQELHSAPAEGRGRLLSALERIGSPEAVPLLRFLSYWDTDKALRQRAAALVTKLRGTLES